MRNGFRQLKEYLDKTEAQTKYPKVTRENSRLKKELTTLKGRLKKATEELSEYKGLKTRFAGKEIDLEEFNKEILEKTRRIYGEEIERKTQEKFKVKAANLTKKELKRLLNLPLKKMPPTLKTLLRTKINEDAENILRSADLWPQWFKQTVDNTIEERVKNRMDDVFWENVGEGVRKAKAEEWNPYLTEYSREKITPYCKNVFLNKFISEATNQVFEMTCTKCGTITHFSLSTDNIAFLFEGRIVYVDCGNPQCRGIFLHTRMPLRLGDLIMRLAGKTAMPN